MSKDLFSGHANQYAVFRPTYPAELYNFLFARIENFDVAWDAGTGNGQVARDLCKRFDKVFATDISARQIENALQANNILYSTAGEITLFSDKSIDLVCVAQAIHWFDRERFYAEVKRVAKPNALLAVWGYGLLKVNVEIDFYISDFYVNIIGSYWDRKRKLINEEYKTITFPFEEISVPPFTSSFQWTLDELQGYLTTWSSVQKFIKEKGFNPVEELIQKIKPAWKSERMQIHFPIFVRAGVVN